MTVRLQMGRGQVPDLVLVIVLLAPGPRLGGVAQHALPGHVGVPGEAPSPWSHQRPLVGGLHRHDEVAAVGHHHVRHLVQGPARHLDAVHLKDLVIDGQESSALCQTPGHESGNKYTRNFF